MGSTDPNQKDAMIRRRLGRWLPGLPWKGWANTWPLGRHWRLAVEWIPAARSFDFWIYDRRQNDV